MKDVAEFARSALKPILAKSGYILYSSANSIRPCPVYLLGHNPGGSPEDQADVTVGRCIDELPTKTLNNYLDESWTTATGRTWAKGHAPLQRRVFWLLSSLGLDPRDVPCSNLIFTRSIDVAASSFDELADLCWPVHERILQVVAPRLLLVFGNSTPSPYRFLFSRWQAASEDSISSGHGDWLCRSFIGANGVRVVGLPHLSRYDVIGKSKVLQWIVGR